MVINDLDIVRITFSPDEADAVPIVNTNTVLSFAVPAERLETIARENGQVSKLIARIQLLQLESGHPRNALEPRARAAGEERFGFFVPKRADQPGAVYNVLRYMSNSIEPAELGAAAELRLSRLRWSSAGSRVARGRMAIHERTCALLSECLEQGRVAWVRKKHIELQVVPLRIVANEGPISTLGILMDCG